MFYDLGSSEMNLDLAIEMYEGSHHIKKIDAPIVEGSFTASETLSCGTTDEAVKKSLKLLLKKIHLINV